ncbi:VOC family protein [Nonomuraea indica]|uniref:VOC family protein n=1 Tax=Nonomuraea indica TaxID=1581193 RepID=UPI00318370AF
MPGSWVPTVEEVRARQMPPTLLFVRVPEGKTVKNRLHLDVSPIDGSTDAEVARLLGLGAVKVDVGQGPGRSWVVMADPEGDEFCVLRTLAPSGWRIGRERRTRCRVLTVEISTLPRMYRERILLTHPGTSKPKYLELRADGVDLHRSWWTGAGKPQERLKSFGSGRAAREALEKIVTEKMGDGYALLRDVAAAEPGDVVVQCATPAANGTVAFALHPDGGTLAVARGIPDRVRLRLGSEVQTVDLRTGARRVVYADASRSSAVHDMAFEPDGTHLSFTVRNLRDGVDTSHTVELATGHVRRLPRACSGRDAVAGRMLVSDDHTVRVLGPDGRSCLDLPAGEPSRAGAVALSPSGRLVGLIRHPDGRDTEYDLEIWDVDTGRRVLGVPYPFPTVARGVGKLMFDRTEQLLVVSGATWGCGGVSVESGVFCWTIEGGLADVALSPDGTRLAAARVRGPVVVHDAATGQPLEPRFVVPGEPSLTYDTVEFSADGRLLAVGDSPGRVTVFRFDGLEFTAPGG